MSAHSLLFEYDLLCYKHKNEESPNGCELKNGFNANFYLKKKKLNSFLNMNKKR